jgi:GTP-binding protein EngB required for normal cell division
VAGGELSERIGALERAVELARGRLPDGPVEVAGTLVTRARGRLGHGTAWTVVALAGATGSGKSSLFNALIGQEISPASVRRPTTGTAHACVWGEASAEGLLDWLGVSRVHRMGGGDAAVPDGGLDGLVLLDLPDHDSVRLEHRLEMSSLIELVDLMVWVVDPEKYADAALHNGFLRPLADHSEVMLFALNQVDRLSGAELRACLRDLTGLLKDDGLGPVPIVATSAVDGTGVAELRGHIAARVEEKRAAVRRIEADLVSAAAELARVGGLDGKATAVGGKTRKRLVTGLGEAAGVPTITDAVAAGYRRDALGRVGWPVTRWLAGFRAHPLRRLGLQPGRTEGATSLPRPGKTQLATLQHTLREVAEEASRGLAPPWPSRIRGVVLGDTERLADPLDQAIAAAELRTERAPGWWGLFGLSQTVLLVAAVGGLLWLGVLFGFSYLRLPEPATPEWRGFPIPTLMAVGGVAGGILLGLVGRGLARLGARRRAARAEKVLGEGIQEVAEAWVLEPLAAELASRTELAQELAVVEGGRGRH